MSLARKVLAYGLLGVIGAGIGWALTWTLTRRPRHHVYTADRFDP